MKDIKVFLKKKKKKEQQYGHERYKHLPEDKKKLLSIEKNIKWEKTPYHNYKKLLCLKVIRFESINLVQKANSNKKMENYKSKKI